MGGWGGERSSRRRSLVVARGDRMELGMDGDGWGTTEGIGIT